MNIGKYSPAAKLFYMRKMDWSMTCHPRGEGKWTVFADGKVKANRELSFNDLLKHHDTEFSTEDFSKFCDLLDDFIDIEDDRDGCDGVGYEMILYSENGNVIHKFCGYIYSNSTLQKIAKLIERF